MVTVGKSGTRQAWGLEQQLRTECSHLRPQNGSRKSKLRMARVFELSNPPLVTYVFIKATPSKPPQIVPLRTSAIACGEHLIQITTNVI